MPPLPRILKKKEANWTTSHFKPWCENVYKKTFSFEVKHTKGKDYLNFNEVQPHQIERLLTTRHGTFYFKIPDMGDKNPLDGVCLTEQPAYVVIKYERFFCLIGIDTFLLEKERSKRRSLTAERACSIATIVVANK